MHRCDFQLSVYTGQHTYNAPTSGLLLGIQQDRVYRFKQIWVFSNSKDFGTSGTLQSYLNFWQGAIAPGVFNRVNGIIADPTQAALAGAINTGILVSRVPVGIAISPTSNATVAWGANSTAHWTQTLGNCFPYWIVRTTGPTFLEVPQTFNVEIVCDYMTLDFSWTGNQFDATPALLACIGSTHPPSQYPEYNFTPI